MKTGNWVRTRRLTSISSPELSSINSPSRQKAPYSAPSFFQARMPAPITRSAERKFRTVNDQPNSPTIVGDETYDHKGLAKKTKCLPHLISMSEKASGFPV